MNTDEWQSMDTFPKDGTRCDILCDYNQIAEGIFWGMAPMGKKYVLRGEQNVLSPFLAPQGWRKHK